MCDIQVIRNYNDANILLERGHKIIKIDRDRRNREFLIFLFENNVKLQQDLKEITPWANNKTWWKDWLKSEGFYTSYQ